MTLSTTLSWPLRQASANGKRVGCAVSSLPASRPDIQIDSIKVQTIRELQDTGYDVSKDRIFRGLNINQDDYAATVTVSSHGHKEGMIIMLRRAGDGLVVAGAWD